MKLRHVILAVYSGNWKKKYSGPKKMHPQKIFEKFPSLHTELISLNSASLQRLGEVAVFSNA